MATVGARSEPSQRRRQFGAALIGCVLLPAAGLGRPCAAQAAAAPTAVEPAASSSAAWQALQAGGAIVLYRHALAPGTGDPPGFRLGECASQRNLSEEGREQATRMGAALRQRQVRVGAVWSSQWCRALETARLMAVGTVIEKPEFNSFFDDRVNEARYVEVARRALLSHTGTGNLVVVTHQVHVTGLTGVFPASGEGVVAVRRPVAGQHAGLTVVGRLPA